MGVGVDEGIRVRVPVVLSMVGVCTEAYARICKLMIPASITEVIRVPFAHSVGVAVVHLDDRQEEGGHVNNTLCGSSQPRLLHAGETSAVWLSLNARSSEKMHE